MIPGNLAERRYWIFDLDGTLTVPVHDFGFIRQELEIPDGSDILGHLAALDPDEAMLRRKRLHEIEHELAERAEAATGAVEVVERLSARGARLGILTRNSRELALMTLEVIGLGHLFDMPSILGRDEAPPKPDPEGINRLLSSWGAAPCEAVMVGDYLFDLQAGKGAGTMTVHVGRPDGQTWPEVTDLAVPTLEGLARLLGGAV